MTSTAQAVLKALLDQPTANHYGLELIAATGLPAGALHPILARLESAHWIESGWETADPHPSRRPLRRCYRLTPDGLVSARQALAAASSRRALAGLVLRPAEGTA